MNDSMLRRVVAPAAIMLVAAGLVVVFAGNLLSPTERNREPEFDGRSGGASDSGRSPVVGAGAPRGVESDDPSGRKSNRRDGALLSEGTARPIRFDVEGVVSDDTGAPLVDAEVRASYASATNAWTTAESPVAAVAKTDVEGAYRIEGLDGAQRYELEARHPSFAFARRKDVASGVEGPVRLDLVLSRGATISGRVVGPDDVPLGGVRVRAFDLGRPTDDGAGVLERETTTDAKGAFTLPGLVFGAKALRADGAGFAPARVEPLRPTPGAAANVTLRMTPGRPLSGRVVRDVGDGAFEPLGGARVVARFLTARGGATLAAPLPPTATTTDASGAFRFEALPDVQFAFMTTPKDGEEVAALALTPEGAPYVRGVGASGGADDFVELRVPRPTTGRVLGRVFDVETGASIPQFFLWTSRRGDPYGDAAGRKLVEHPEGLFTTDALSPGSWFVFAEAASAPPGVAGPLVVEAGRATPGAEIGLAPGVVVRGVVLDDARRPVVGARIAARPATSDASTFGPGAVAGDSIAPRGDAAPGRATTASDGSFEMRVGRGAWRLHVDHPDLVPTTTDPIGCNADADAGVVIARRAGVVYGFVVDPSTGGPDPEATIQAIREGSVDRRDGKGAVTGADGGYVLAGLEPGLYRISIVRRGGRVLFGASETLPTVVSVLSGEKTRRDF